MAKFKSETYPNLRVGVGGGASVKFIDGQAEATGKAADALRNLDDSYGVSEVKSGSSKSTNR